MELMTVATSKLFRDLAYDAGKWNGCPMVDGNVPCGPALRGNLTDLKKRGLLTTFVDKGQTWVAFTDLGRQYAAAAFGIAVRPPL